MVLLFKSIHCLMSSTYDLDSDQKQENHSPCLQSEVNVFTYVLRCVQRDFGNSYLRSRLSCATSINLSVLTVTFCLHFFFHCFFTINSSGQKYYDGTASILANFSAIISSTTKFSPRSKMPSRTHNSRLICLTYLESFTCY